MFKTTNLVVLLLLILTGAASLRAEGITVSAVAMTESTTRDHALVQFTVSWRNSWRSSSELGNHDAAWVFVKFRERGGAWRHATLSTHPEHHVVRKGSRIAERIEVGLTDGRGVGVFLSRAKEGRGLVTWRDVNLRWDRAADGVARDARVELRVHAIEMVHVPQGSFFAGDGSRTTVQGHLHRAGLATRAYLVEGRSVVLGGQDERNLANNDAVGMFSATEDDFNSLVTQTLPPAFPTGYDGFYCMKYEITEQQYVDFLNSLTPAQQLQRAYTSGESGNEIRLRNGVYVSGVPEQACSNLNWADGAAYCDWAGLRPMTELEFEKACRGPVEAVPNAYAWGDTTLPTIMGGAGFPVATADVETDEDGDAAEGYRSGGGPRHDQRLPAEAVRAAGAAQGPSEFGASYWGIMDLSGRLWERCVSIGHPVGRAFTGATGDGTLDAQGNADVRAWPGIDAAGAGFRGGAIFDKITARRVSDRYYANYASDYRYGNSGFRGVR